MTKLYYKDLWGKRKDKKAFLQSRNVYNTDFIEVDIDEFNKRFRNTRWGSERFTDDLSFFKPLKDLTFLEEYGDGWGVHEIFENYVAGINTGKDSDFISIEKDKFKQFDDYDDNFIYKIAYRTFDIRYIYYDIKIIQRARFSIMQHFLKENIGFCFSRGSKREKYDFAIAVKNLSDRHLLGSQTYVAPLYLYKQDENQTSDDIFHQFNSDNKRPNFKEEFTNFITKKYGEVTPEEILGYIYGVLYCPTYREKYLEFLKIDFPRINFSVDKTKFKELSNLGWELIQAHIMEQTPPSYASLGEPYGKNKEVVKLVHNEKEEKLYINESLYYENVTKDIWEFQIGGYQVLSKYLTARKGRELTSDEINHIQKVIQTLAFTIDQMQKIDETYQKTGQ